MPIVASDKPVWPPHAASWQHTAAACLPPNTFHSRAAAVQILFAREYLQEVQIGERQVRCPPGLQCSTARGHACGAGYVSLARVCLLWRCPFWPHTPLLPPLLTHHPRPPRCAPGQVPG